MRIKQTRVQNIWRFLGLFEDEEKFHIALTDLEKHKDRLVEAGFTSDLEVGEKVLPTPLGSVSTFNAVGKDIIRDDLPMETATRELYWTRSVFGRYEESVFVDIPYKRYPREFIEPPSEELQIVESNGEKLLISRVLIKSYLYEEEIKHLMNLFLQLFGECDLLKENLVPPIGEDVINLNWEILSPGEYPWEEIEDRVSEVVNKQSVGIRPVIAKRLDLIKSFDRDFTAIGRGGFNDYVVYGFIDKNLYVFESLKESNATYVFRDDWESLSKLTKKEILSNNLQEARLIHDSTWESRIKSLLE